MRESYQVKDGPLVGKTYALTLASGQETTFEVDGVNHVYYASVKEYDSGLRFWSLYYVGIDPSA